MCTSWPTTVTAPRSSKPRAAPEWVLSALAGPGGQPPGGHRFERVGALGAEGAPRAGRVSLTAAWEPLDDSVSADLTTRVPPPGVHVPLPPRFAAQPVFISPHKRTGTTLHLALEAAARRSAPDRDPLGRARHRQDQPGGSISHVTRRTQGAVRALRTLRRGPRHLVPTIRMARTTCARTRPSTSADTWTTSRLLRTGSESGSATRHDIDPRRSGQCLCSGSVVDLLGHVAASTPLVLVLDDLRCSRITVVCC